MKRAQIIQIFLLFSFIIGIYTILVVNFINTSPNNQEKSLLYNPNNEIELLSEIPYSIEWYRTWCDGGYYFSASGNGLAVDAHGFIYLVGKYGRSYSYTQDILLMKYNAAGTLLWNQTLDGNGYGVAVDAAGYIYLAGSRGVTGLNDAILVKFDATGNQLWNRTWGGTSDDYGYDVTVDTTGFIYLVGETLSLGAGDSDAFLVKYNSAGTKLWERTWGGASSDEGTGVAVDSSGSIYLAGTTWSFGAGNCDAFLAKYDSDGNKLWDHTWGGSSWDKGNGGVGIDGNSSVYLAGFTKSFGYCTFLVKYNSTGTELWSRVFNFGIMSEICGEVAVSADGSAYIVGNAFINYHDVFLVKYNSVGTQLWYLTWGGTDNDYGYGVAVGSDDVVYFTGTTESFGSGYSDAFIAKCGKDSDGDGLTDHGEINLYGTDPYKADTDNDTIPDGWELFYGMDATDSTDAGHDFEPDGLVNLIEYEHRTNPINNDTDDDGLNDSAEVYLYPTNATDRDTDDDYIPDGWEVFNGLDPLDPTDASEDFDQDGLLNGGECYHNTDPNNPDTDGDGYTDKVEVDAETDPTDPKSIPIWITLIPLLQIIVAVSAVAVTIESALTLTFRHKHPVKVPIQKIIYIGCQIPILILGCLFLINPPCTGGILCVGTIPFYGMILIGMLFLVISSLLFFTRHQKAASWLSILGVGFCILASLAGHYQYWDSYWGYPSPEPIYLTLAAILPFPAGLPLYRRPPKAVEAQGNFN